MPAEPRRTRKLTSEEDIELKRARGEISCAECRRLKLKCDKKLPCGSCVRRGCTTICPNGSLSGGQGTRFILADTDQLHRKIAEMSERIRQLEDALSIFQSGISSQRHPLLRDELLSVKYGLEARRPTDEESTKHKLSTAIDALGTLTLGEHGQTKFIGRSGSAEALFLTAVRRLSEQPGGDANEDLDDPESPVLDEDIDSLSFTFPLSIVPGGTDEILYRLEAELPPRPRAWALCEAYLAHLSWWFRPLKRDELINEILSPIYKTVDDPTNRGAYHPNTGCGRRCPHLLAVLYLILALGALVDLTLSPCSAEAERYYRLGRAALSLRSIFDSLEFETLQAVALMASYHSLCSMRYSTESAWTLVSLAARLSTSLGLHRDSARCGLGPKVVDRRRNLFWETFILEAIHCMALGRPPSLSRIHIDCELPTDEEQTFGKEGQPIEGYWHWKSRYQQAVIHCAYETLTNTETPNYEVILELDRKIRQISVPDVKLFPKPEEEEYGDPTLCMQGAMMSHIRCIAMLGIHRTFFTQTLLDHPSNPLKSPYAPSFLAANRSASVMIKSFLHHCERCPNLYGRFWSMWTHAFTACVILGSTVARCPSATMAPTALIELDFAVDMFKKGSEYSLRAHEALPMLVNLRDKATHSYQLYRNRHILPSPNVRLNISPRGQEDEDDLAMFGGKTRVMASKFSSPRPSKGKKASTNSSPHSSPPDYRREHSSPPESSPSPGESSIHHSMGGAFREVRPSLRDYLFSSPAQMDELTQPFIVPSMVPMRSTTPGSHNAATSTSMSAFASSLHQSGQSSFSSVIDSPEMPPPPGFPVSNMHIQSNTFSNIGDGTMDSVSWYAVVNGTYMTEFPDTENTPLGGDHAMANHQWMSLMRDTGMFEHIETGTGTTPTTQQHRGNTAQPESIPEGVNMIY